MSPTTIQVNEDVKAKLESMKEGKDSYNDVLLEVLGMKEPKSVFEGKTPNRYMAEIYEERFRNDEKKNSEFLEAVGLDEDENEDMLTGNLSTDKTIDGVDISIDIYSTLEIEVEDKTQEGLLAKLNVLQHKLPFKLTKENFCVRAGYCCTSDEFDSMLDKKDD